MSPRIVVIGEAMLDVDVDGEASRLSPDAPVPVLDQLAETPRPGGAALAASMAAVAGADVTLATPIVADDAGRLLEKLLPPRVRVIRLAQSGGTPVKRRIRARGQSLVRLDEGGTSAPWDAVPPELVTALESADGILVSDYGRGLTKDPRAREILASFARHTPLVWDPHPRGGTPVRGTALFTPNHSELRAIVGDVAADANPDTDIAGILEQLDAALPYVEARAIAVTIGSRGAVLSLGHGTPQLFCGEPIYGQDACGAGDQFASAATYSLATGRLVSESVQDAVAAASRHVAEGGAAAFGRRAKDRSRPVIEHADPEALATSVWARHGTVVATGGCFDILHAGHVSYLQAARRLGDCLIVCLNSDVSVRRLKGPARPVVDERDRARVLLSLGCVDAVIVFDEDSPQQVMRLLRPHIWAKGGDYAGDVLEESAVLREWGGRALTLPYLDGRSTTAILRTITDTANSIANTDRVTERKGATYE